MPRFSHSRRPDRGNARALGEVLSLTKVRVSAFISICIKLYQKYIGSFWQAEIALSVLDMQ